MHTLVAFSEVPAVAATSGTINAVPDQTHRVSGDDIYIGKFNQLIGECAIGPQITDAYLISPSLRRVARKYVAPLFITPSSYIVPLTWNWHGESPLKLDTNEALNAYATETSLSAVHNDIIGVWLADGPVAPVHGEIWTVHASVSGTFAELAWGNAEMTWTPDLPVGKYQIVGARCYMEEPGLFRFNFVGGFNRPGGVCIHEYHLSTMPWQRNGGMGVWGEFEQVLPPSIDLLPQAVNGETEAYLRIDLIKIA